MATQRRDISATDVREWTTLDDIVNTLELRGLEELEDIDQIDELADDVFENIDLSHVRVLKLAESYYIAVIEAEADKSPADYKRLARRPLRTILVIDEYETFTFYSEKPSFDSDSRRRTFQQFKFKRENFTDDGHKYSILDKLNDLEHGDPTSPQNLYDTRAVVKQFYEEFENIRSELIEDVSGLTDPEKPGQEKARYVQVVFNRLIFLHFIQEKGLLNRDRDYLKTRHQEAQATEQGAYETFWEPLFFRVLAEDESGYIDDEDDELDVSFVADDELPYLNGGLFSEDEIERKHPSIQLGVDSEEEDSNYDRILKFLGRWNWNVDERLDIVEPKNLSPDILGHIFEQTVNQKEHPSLVKPHTSVV